LATTPKILKLSRILDFVSAFGEITKSGQTVALLLGYLAVLFLNINKSAIFYPHTTIRIFLESIVLFKIILPLFLAQRK